MKIEEKKEILNNLELICWFKICGKSLFIKASKKIRSLRVWRDRDYLLKKSELIKKKNIPVSFAGLSDEFNLMISMFIGLFIFEYNQVRESIRPSSSDGTLFHSYHSNDLIHFAMRKFMIRVLIHELINTFETLRDGLIEGFILSSLIIQFINSPLPLHSHSWKLDNFVFSSVFSYKYIYLFYFVC